jgi:hypothetical protein
VVGESSGVVGGDGAVVGKGGAGVWEVAAGQGGGSASGKRVVALSGWRVCRRRRGRAGFGSGVAWGRAGARPRSSRAAPECCSRCPCAAVCREPGGHSDG